MYAHINTHTQTDTHTNTQKHHLLEVVCSWEQVTGIAGRRPIELAVLGLPAMYLDE